MNTVVKNVIKQFLVWKLNLNWTLDSIFIAGLVLICDFVIHTIPIAKLVFSFNDFILEMNTSTAVA